MATISFIQTPPFKAMVSLLIAISSGYTATATATDANADDDQVQCKAAGSLVMHTWHRLDVCQANNHLRKNAAAQAKSNIKNLYPQIAKDIQQKSGQSQLEWSVANNTPWDPKAKENAELWRNMCNTSLSLAGRYADREWQETLACWK